MQDDLVIDETPINSPAIVSIEEMDIDEENQVKFKINPAIYDTEKSFSDSESFSLSELKRARSNSIIVASTTTKEDESMIREMHAFIAKIALFQKTLLSI